jgi:hypothetical protein
VIKSDVVNGEEVKIKPQPGEKMFVVEQGRFFAGLRTYEVADRSTGTKRAQAFSRSDSRSSADEDEGVFQQRYLPLDPYGSQSIDNKLFQRVLDREPILWEELRRGADRDRLRNEVEKARLLIRDALDREVGYMAGGMENRHLWIDTMRSGH